MPGTYSCNLLCIVLPETCYGQAFCGYYSVYIQGKVPLVIPDLGLNQTEPLRFLPVRYIYRVAIRAPAQNNNFKDNGARAGLDREGDNMPYEGRT